MILTETEVKKLVRKFGHTIPNTYDDAVQEALIAVLRAEEEKPGDKKHAVGRAVTAARNYTRKERTRLKNFGGGNYNGPLSLSADRCSGNVPLLESENFRPHGHGHNLEDDDFHAVDFGDLLSEEDTGITETQVGAFYTYLGEQDEDTRKVLNRYLAGETMIQISRETLISHSQVSRIIKRFTRDAAKAIGETE